MRRFVDRLQTLDANLPLRTVPLEVQIFTPVKQRLKGEDSRDALKNQQIAIEAWQKELGVRYTSAERARNIAEVPLGRHGYEG